MLTAPSMASEPTAPRDVRPVVAAGLCLVAVILAWPLWRGPDDAPPVPLMPGHTSDGSGVATSGDDFAGVRPYQAGDPQKMIAWKLAARSDELSVKLFDAPAGGELVLDFDTLPFNLDLESKLSRLARWFPGLIVRQSKKIDALGAAGGH